MFSIKNSTNNPVVVRLANFEGVAAEEIVLALQPEQSGDLGDLDDGVVIIIEEG